MENCAVAPNGNVHSSFNFWLFFVSVSNFNSVNSESVNMLFTGGAK